MARIRDYTITEYIANTLTWVPDMPTHQSGDLLIVAIGKDGITGFTGTPGGWSSQQEQASNGAYGAIFTKVAASSTETFSITMSTTDTGVAVCLAIKNVYSGAEVNVSGKTAADDSTVPYAGLSGVSTTQNNCLVFHFLMADGGIAPTAYSPLVNLYNGDAANGGMGVAYTYQKTSGAIPAVDWYGNAAEDTREFLLAVRSGDDSDIEAYADVTLTSGQMIRSMAGIPTTQSDTWPVTLQLANIGDDYDSAYKYVGATPTDILAALNDTTAADVTFPTAAADLVYFGSDERYRYLTFNVSTAGSGGTITWEIYSGGSWISTGMPTQNLTATGWQRVDITKANQALMEQTAINSVTKYWVRARIATQYSRAIVLTQGRKDGYATTYGACTSSADAGANPYNNATTHPGASSVTNLGGCEYLLGAAENMSSGILIGTIRPSLPRDFAIDIALPIEPCGGVQLTLFDASILYASYKIGAKGCKTLDVAGRSVFAIDWNGTSTPWATRGSVSKSAVTRLMVSSFGFYGAAAMQWSMLCRVVKVAVAGGSSTYLLDLARMAYAANNCFGTLPLIQIVGSSAKIYAPLQFGGGDPVFISCDLNTFQFPTKYDGVDFFDWNVAENVAGVLFKPKSGDVIKFTNSVFTSDSAYRWEWDASSAGSGWTGDFSGTNIVRATVTLRDVFTFSRMAFVSCPSLTQNGAPLSSCAIKYSKLMCDDPGAVYDCSFYSAGSPGGHAIEITSSAGSGAYTFDGNQFFDYGADGSTDAAIYNNSGKAITLNITGGVASPTVRNGAGASTTVNNFKTLSLTGLKANSEVRVFRTSDDTELAGIENSGISFSYEYNYVSDTNVYIVVHALNYLSLRYEGQVLGISGLTIPVQQQTDRQYLNP
jgi:hypothetical protein